MANGYVHLETIFKGRWRMWALLKSDPGMADEKQCVVRDKIPKLAL